MLKVFQRLKRFRPRGLAGYMGLAFSTLSIALTVVVVEVVEREATRHVEHTIGHGLGELALQASDKLDRGMFERYREVGLIASRFALADASLSRADWRHMLDDVRKTYTYYSWIGLADPHGTVMVSAGGLLEGADVSARPWFKGAQKGAGYVGDVHEAVLLSRLLPQAGAEPLRFVDVAFPFRDRDGKDRGVLGTHLSWQWARDVERSIIEPLETERRVQALIVGKNGVVLLGPPHVQGRTVDFPSLREARNSSSPGYVIEKGIDGKTYMTGYSRSKGYADYPGLGWTVLVRQDIDNAMLPVKRLRSHGLWSGIALALLFSIAGVFVARWITRPLMQLGAEAAKIGQGGGQAKGIPAQDQAYDEVQALAGTLNALVGDQQRRQAQLEELNATLERRVQERTQALAEALSVVRQSGQRINAIIETAQDAFIGIDLRGRVIDWNSQAEAMFGWSRDEVIGRSLGSLIVPERFLAHFERAIRMANESGHLEVFERTAERIVQTRGGTELPIEMTASLVVGPGTDFFSIFVRDISMRKRVEQMKNELVATVSHELRTPLTSMRASLSLLDSGAVEGVPDDAKELIEIAHRHCERLVRMVNEMLDVEKVESGHVHLLRTEQELAPILRDAVAAMQGHAREAGVHLGCAGTLPGVHAAVDGDRLTQVITNLLSNAIKFAPAGSVVEAALGWHGDGVRIAVLDRGPGIPADFRGRIFERFAQSEDEARRRQGSGLGLSISKKIVEEHGGRIGFEDRVGGGTVFYVDLPLHTTDAARSSVESAH